MLTGYLSINKKKGVRSTWCVETVRRAFGGKIKTGHGGTLDSTASGMLVILLGGATRTARLITAMPKVYHVTVRLGSETTTCDASGDITRSAPWAGIGDEALRRILPGFLGLRMQVPPEISAVHVGGTRAHLLARSGMEPEITPRPIYIESISITSPLDERGEFALRVACGQGTYVRSLARDIGRALGNFAHVAELERESVGHFNIKAAIAMGEDFSAAGRDLAGQVLPLASLCSFLPSYRLPDPLVKALSSGQVVTVGGEHRISSGGRGAGDMAMVLSEEHCSICRTSAGTRGLLLSPLINVPLEEVRR